MGLQIDRVAPQLRRYVSQEHFTQRTDNRFPFHDLDPSGQMECWSV